MMVILSLSPKLELCLTYESLLESKRSSPSLLARQLRLRLIAADDSDIPKNLSNIIVSIHAIATFQALHDYLRPRLSSAEPSQCLQGSCLERYALSGGDLLFARRFRICVDVYNGRIDFSNRANRVSKLSSIATIMSFDQIYFRKTYMSCDGISAASY